MPGNAYLAAAGGADGVSGGFMNICMMAAGSMGMEPGGCAVAGAAAGAAAGWAGGAGCTAAGAGTKKNGVLAAGAGCGTGADIGKNGNMEPLPGAGWGAGAGAAKKPKGMLAAGAMGCCGAMGMNGNIPCPEE